MELVKITEISGEPAVRLDFPYNPKIIDIIKNNFNYPDRMFVTDHWTLHKKHINRFLDIMKSEGILINLSPRLQEALSLNSIGLTKDEELQAKHYKATSPSYLVRKNLDTKYLDMPLEIYDYQKVSLDFAIKRNGRLFIADDMGIGKTAQAIAISLHYRQDFPVVVIAQSSLLYNWKKEYEKFTRIEDNQINVLKGKKKIRGQVVIVSYDYAHKNKDKLSQFLGVKGIVIIDEAHNIKNKDSQAAPSNVELANLAKRAVIMTGTPFLSKPIEAWTLLKSVHSNFYAWRDYKEFAERYCQGGLREIKTQQNGRQVVRKIYYDAGASRILEFHNMIRDNVMLRRLKTDKGILDDLPDKARFTQFFETNDKNNEYNLLVDKIVGVIEDNADIKDRDRLKTIIYSELGEEGKKQILQMYSQAGVSKVDSVNEWINNWIEQDNKYLEEKVLMSDESEKGKLIVFGHHKEFIANVTENLEKLKKKFDFEFLKIDSDISSMSKRFEMAERFQNDEKVRVIVLSIKVASVGLNLTSASDTLFGEIPWTPSIAQQAECRSYRNGQKHNTSFYYAISNNKIDTVLWNIISHKSKVLSSMVDGGYGDEMETEFNDNDLFDSIIIETIDDYFNGNIKINKEDKVDED